MINRKNNNDHPLDRTPRGRHKFGGHPFHKGITPKGSDVPTHLIFEVDLTDPDLPFDSPDLKTLPLYYPLKYGIGGPGMQYRIASESEIEIIYMTDPEPDPADEAYVQVSEFPEVRFQLLPAVPDVSDLGFDIPTLGGKLESGENEPCMNPKCQSFETAEQCELLASIPPVEIEGYDEIWGEFEDAYMFFHFWYCQGCQTVITNNRCT